VADLGFLHILDCDHKLFEVKTGHRFRKFMVFLQKLKKITFLAIFKDYTKFLGIQVERLN